MTSTTPPHRQPGIAGPGPGEGSRPAPPEVLAIVGSLRAASYNHALACAARAAAAPALRLAVTGLHGIPVFSEDLEERGLPARVRALGGRVLAAAAVLIVTPEYNFSIPGGLKNALDWLSRDPREPLRGRPAAVAGATPGTGGTRQAQAAVRHVLNALGAHCLPLPPLEISRASQKFNAAGQLTDPVIRAQLDCYLNEFGKWLGPAARAA
jgi:chromate reductase